MTSLITAVDLGSISNISRQYQQFNIMKNLGNKLLVFYYFQLQSNRDYNVTTISSSTPTIKDILSVLPFDLSHGLYHFRFKSELTDGDEKVLAWIDINNIMAKVPQVNGSIYMKILKLKDPAHNKLFHLQKLKKAQIVKVNGTSQNFVNKNMNPTNTNNNNARPNIPSNQQLQTKPQPQPPQTKTNNPSLLQPAKHQNNTQKAPTVAPVATNTTAVNLLPEKPAFVTTTIQQNLQTFSKQFATEQQNFENERIAQNELQQPIRKWGYTDGKKINNTTTLLATLHEIWPEWEKVSLTDMLKPEQVNATFKKAVIKVHPDKNRQRNFRQKYLSKRVFQLLNESRKQ